MSRITEYRSVRWAFLFSVAGLLVAVLATSPVTVRAGDGPRDAVAAGVAGDGVAFYQVQGDGKEPPKPPADDSFQDEAQPIGGIRKLTPEEINRVRYMELRGMRLTTEKPDRVAVKVPKDTIDDFLLDMEGHPEFRGEETRRQFRRLTAPQKLHWIARYRGAKYADRVEIRSDPEVFVNFKKHVLPVVLRSCATSGCHGYGTSREPFVLFNDPKRSVATTYADFVALATKEHEGNAVLDRAHPENSLLLTYLLPEADVKPELRHPGNVAVKPAFRTRKAIGYRRIRDWVASLKHPAEDYGVDLSNGTAEESLPAKEEFKPEDRPATP